MSDSIFFTIITCWQFITWQYIVLQLSHVDSKCMNEYWQYIVFLPLHDGSISSDSYNMLIVYVATLITCWQHMV